MPKGPKGPSEHLSDNVFRALLTISNRVYASDIENRQACAQFITTLERRVDSGEFMDEAEPYRRLFAGIQANWPEVWNDRGQEVYERFMSGEPDE